MQADGEDDEQDAGDNEARILERAVGTEGEPAGLRARRVCEGLPADPDHETVLRSGEDYETAREDRRADNAADCRPPGRDEGPFHWRSISRGCLPYMLSSPWTVHNAGVTYPRLVVARGTGSVSMPGPRRVKGKGRT